MSSAVVYLMPVSFGYGPAALAIAVARALRAINPSLTLVGIADGHAFELLENAKALDRVIVADVGKLGNVGSNHGEAVFVSFADFSRAKQAVERGFKTMVVDPLWWMWAEPPPIVQTSVRYLALRFPGMDELALIDEYSNFRVVPQVVEVSTQIQPHKKREGLLLNLGGGVAPNIDSTAFFQALLNVVAWAFPNEEVLVASSSQVVSNLEPPVDSEGRVSIRVLKRVEMLDELCSRRQLLTVPGQSIVWEALVLRTPMLPAGLLLKLAPNACAASSTTNSP